MGEGERSFGSDVSVEIYKSPTESFLLNITKPEKTYLS